MRIKTFLSQRPALLHAKAMLFINDSQPQIVEGNIFLDDRVGTNQNIKGPFAEAGQYFLFARLQAYSRSKAGYSSGDLALRPIGPAFGSFL